MSVDDAQGIFSSIVEDVKKNIENITSEEDAKIQIILRILTDVLGWSYSDIGAERKQDNGFSDFIVSSADKKAFVLEAKRLGVLSVPTKELTKVRHLKLSGNTLLDVQDGIEQAEGYAAPNGITIAVLSDGMRWIIFKSFVSGANYKSQKSFVFPSFEAIQNDFTVFYELLSKCCFGKKLYSAHFDQIQNKRILLSQTLKSPLQEREIKIQPKSNIAFDLDQVFTAFFSRLTGDQDEDLLLECFVETRESRIADFALEKITANVLGNISPPDKQVDDELNRLIQQAVEVESGQTVFVVGPTGAGKTTFLDRFFKRTLSPILRKQCVVVSVNCLDSSGREDTALQWLTETLISKLESILYDENSPSWEQLRGLYYSDYKRRSKGVDALLYKRDPDAFKEKFSVYLDEKVENDREGYLRRILADVVSNRKKLPIILIDNTDEFSPEFKKEIFQFSQSLRRAVNHCILLFPVTDKSAWSFSKTDLYSIYKSKSFFLPTPPPREVFRKRIDFIRNKIEALSSEKDRREYMSKKGIRISIKNLEGFASIIEDVFVDNEYTSKTIGEIANYNIRRTLELSQRVITSTVYQIGDLLKAVVSGGVANLSYSKFMNALMKGDYEVYKPNDNHFILPIFQVSESVKQSPLLNVRILSLLKAVKNAARTVEDKHLNMQSLSNYFDSLGCSEAALDAAVLCLLEAGLIEPFDSSVKNIEPNQRVAITHSGLRHLELSLFNSIFFEQMALTTAIVNHDMADQIRGIYHADCGYREKMNKIRSVFYDYIIREDAANLVVPENGEQFESQREVVNSLSKFITLSENNPQESVDRVFEEILAKAIIATVDWWDLDRGYGFVDVEGKSYQAFLHVQALKDCKVDQVFDGDKLLCDIAKNEKGIFVKTVHDLEAKENTVETVDAEVIRIFPDRRYGFVQISGGGRSAFFHFSNIDKEILDNLRVGKQLKVQISQDKSGKGFLVRNVVHK
ncbi:MAG: cold shock domain-containing protein [Candidatus Thiodiazotropha sp.]